MLRTTAMLMTAALLAACHTPTESNADLAISTARGGRTAVRTITSGTISSTDGSTSSISPQPLRFLPDAPPLRTYDTTFVTYQGWKKNLVIFHTDGNYFMVLDVPGTAQFVDDSGVAVPDGERVDIRARVDSEFITFEFGPHGSYFTGSRPVVLWVYLKYADLEGRGGAPKIWYQSDDTQNWEPIDTTVDQAGRWLKIELRHFSNYAVAW